MLQSIVALTETFSPPPLPPLLITPQSIAPLTLPRPLNPGSITHPSSIASLPVPHLTVPVITPFFPPPPSPSLVPLPPLTATPLACSILAQLTYGMHLCCTPSNKHNLTNYARTTYKVKANRTNEAVVGRFQCLVSIPPYAP
jgi:hypothetical protein